MVHILSQDELSKFKCDVPRTGNGRVGGCHQSWALQACFCGFSKLTSWSGSARHWPGRSYSPCSVWCREDVQSLGVVQGQHAKEGAEDSKEWLHVLLAEREGLRCCQVLVADKGPMIRTPCSSSHWRSPILLTMGSCTGAPGCVDLL